MKFHRLLVVLTVFNLGLLVFLPAQIEVRFLGLRFLPRSPEVNSAGSVFRRRGLDRYERENIGRLHWFCFSSLGIARVRCALARSPLV